MATKPPPEQRQWFTTWLAQHIELMPRHDWPEIGEGGRGFYRTFYRWLVDTDTDYSTACLASQRIAYQPPEHLTDHFPRFKAELARIKQERVSEKMAARRRAQGEVDDAPAVDCNDCKGTGAAFRYRHKSRGQGKPDRLTFYCRCAAGRRYRYDDKEEHGRFVHLDLESYPALWGEEFRQPHPDAPKPEPRGNVFNGKLPE